jgi:hypothetical protein
MCEGGPLGMADNEITIAVALIGAVIGSIGGSFAGVYVKALLDQKATRQKIVHRYLLQLQDATDLFQDRLRNLFNLERRPEYNEADDSEQYYTQTTLYTMGSVLAYKRILLLDGVYPQIDRVIKEQLSKLDCCIADISKNNERGFYIYDRQALAEAIMERREDYWQSCTFLDFKKRYEDSESLIKKPTEKARNFVVQIKKIIYRRNKSEPRSILQIYELIKILHDVSAGLGKETKIPSAVKTWDEGLEKQGLDHYHNNKPDDAFECFEEAIKNKSTKDK